MKTTKNFLLCALLCMATVVMAQPANNQHKHPSVEEMQAAKWTYLVEKAQLTDKEQKAVKPIFIAYEQDFWAIHKKLRDQQRKRKLEEFTEEDYRNANEQTVATEMGKAKLLEQYHESLQKVLSPKRLFYYYSAEKDYKRSLFPKAKK